MNRIGFGLIAILAVVLGLLVGTFNSDEVHLDLLWVQVDWPLGLLILLSFAIGLLLGLGLLFVSHVLPLRLRVRKLQSRSGRATLREHAATDD